RDLAVDLHQAVGDALFERTARAEPGLREHLVQALLHARCAGGIGAGFGAALEGELAALVLGHACSCSDDAGSASSRGGSSTSAGSNCSCGSRSPISLSSDSGGSSSSRLSPK